MFLSTFELILVSHHSDLTKLLGAIHSTGIIQSGYQGVGVCRDVQNGQPLIVILNLSHKQADKAYQS